MVHVYKRRLASKNLTSISVVGSLTFSVMRPFSVYGLEERTRFLISLVVLNLEVGKCYRRSWYVPELGAFSMS